MILPWPFPVCNRRLIAVRQCIISEMLVFLWLYAFCLSFLFFFVFSLALLDFVSKATVVVQASVVRPSVVRKLRFCRKPLHGCSPNFVGTPLSTSPEHFLFKIFNFQFLRVFFFVFVNLGPNGSKHFKRPLLLQFLSNLDQKLYSK